MLARAPSAPGKTRLTEALSADRAHALRRALLLDTIESACASGFPLVVCYTPVAARDEFREIARVALGPQASAEHTADALRLIPQAEGNLGDRMRRAFDEMFALWAGHVVLIGSDLPTLPPDRITIVMAALDRSPLVLGPAEDAGYYLIGLRAPHPELFEGVEWGSREVLAQTLARATGAGIAVELAPSWYDIDTPKDLQRVASSPRARHTRGWLRAHTSR